MAKDPSPLLGYNNNIRHRNRVFHIQTEDSGVRHPHIITHLFMDGGRILKSTKTSYAEHLGSERLGDVVRQMMRDQHKKMLMALRDGQCDELIDGADAAKPTAMSAAPPSPSSGPSPRAPAERAPETVDLERAAAVAAKPTFEAPLDMQPPPANLFRPKPEGGYREMPEPGSARPPPTSPGQASRPAPARPRTAVPPGVVVSKSPGLHAAPSLAAPRPAVPSPGMSRPAPSRSPSAPEPSPPAASKRPSAPEPSPPAAPRAPFRSGRPAVGAMGKPAEVRYASARPAAIFGQVRPSGGGSIFGDDIISDKSLDEVIMSYLAEDIGEDGAQLPPAAQLKGRGPGPVSRK